MVLPPQPASRRAAASGALLLGLVALTVLAPGMAQAAEPGTAGGGEHVGVEVFLLQVFAIFVAAKISGRLVERLKAPAVVGEILAGVVLGLAFFRGLLQFDQGMQMLEFLAEIGVVFLLFAVGLETPLHQLTSVGRTSAAVALAGVVTPLAAGFALGYYVLGEGTPESLFLGVALVATSVGITAKVLADKGVLDHAVSRVILGAAVIDDVLGLLILAIAKGIAIGGALHAADIAAVAALAIGFVGVTIALGPRLVRVAVRKVQRGAEEARSEKHGDFGGIAVFAIALCLGLSALASVLGLAALVGAFLAGMAFAEYREQFHLERVFGPLVLFTSPLFFAFIGLQLDLAAAQAALPVIVGVTVVALLTKLVPCAAAAWRMGRWEALSVGAGMAPRGEVGIIVALVGLNAGVVDAELFAVVVTMALLTTIAGPPMLDYTLKHVTRRDAAPGGLSDTPSSPSSQE